MFPFSNYKTVSFTNQGPGSTLYTSPKDFMVFFAGSRNASGAEGAIVYVDINGIQNGRLYTYSQGSGDESSTPPPYIETYGMKMGLVGSTVTVGGGGGFIVSGTLYIFEIG